jgi:hypothetical protein
VQEEPKPQSLVEVEHDEMRGLRANWASALDLHDLHASLLGKSEDGTYFPDGDWQEYEYYGSSMTGNRVAATRSERWSL